VGARAYESMTWWVGHMLVSKRDRKEKMCMHETGENDLSERKHIAACTC
jgi:hypothetical protein